MRKILGAVALTAGLLGALGCGSDGKRIDPKPAEGQSVDPRIKPAEAGGNAADSKTKGATEAPAPIKGD